MSTSEIFLVAMGIITNAAFTALLLRAVGSTSMIGWGTRIRT